MLSLVTLDNAAGEPVTIHEAAATSKRALVSAQGLVGIGAIRESKRVRPQAHGSLNETRFEEGRTIVLPGEVTGTTITECLKEFRAVSQPALETLNNGAALLKWTEDAAGLKLQMKVKLDSEILPILQRADLLLNYQMQLLAEDPRAYSQTVTEATGATITGTAVENEFLKSVPILDFVAVDATFIYWTNHNENTIGRAKLNGTGIEPEWIKGCKYPRGIAIDPGATHVYWANQTGGTGSEGSIGRAKLAAGAAENVEQTWIDEAVGPTGIAVDATYIYWRSFKYPIGSTITRAKIGGTGKELNWITGIGGTGNHGGIAVNASFIYWVEKTGIGRATLAGAEIIGLISGGSEVTGIAVSATFIYWANQTGNTIGRAKLAGTEVNQTFISGLMKPVGLAVNSEHLYWVNESTNYIGRSGSLEGGPKGSTVTIAQAGNRPTPLTFKVYGPITDPSIVRESDGSRITLKGTIASGNYVEINTAERTVKLNGSTNLLSFLNAQNTNWEAFAPLASTKYQLAATSATAAYMECSYRSAYA